MNANDGSVAQYIGHLSSERQSVISKLREQILRNLPEGFEEQISYGMIGYVVPHSLYPAGYHVDPGLPLPFINLASQKNYVALYHMALYVVPELNRWFQEEYGKSCRYKLDMGKSCIRFKRMDDIPYDLIGELAGKMTVAEWIRVYEAGMKR